MKTQEKALVVLSGGQDSTVCLYWARHCFGSTSVEAVTFEYGQRHRIEVDCARIIANIARVPHTVLPINTFASIGGNALTSDSICPDNGDHPDSTFPNTFVPGRNLIFLTFAAALAYTRGIQHIIMGATQVDHSRYPDCRENTIHALEKSIQLGMDTQVKIHTPLMHLSKASTIHLAQEYGAMEALGWSHSCYNGQQPPCGHCISCGLRAQGFAEAGIADPLIKRFQQH